MIDQSLMQPIPGARFKFACHQKVPCFTRCCANLNLILTPYDVLRLKHRLQLSSQVLLDKYTTSYVDDEYGAPAVKLKMSDDVRRSCPFVTSEGCTVYEDRPGACRMYPVGRAASKIPGAAKAGEYYFLIKESHCLGFNEDTEWTVEDWINDQGLGEYNAMNDLFLDITAGKQAKVLKQLSEQQLGMYYMACYNVDQFRSFIVSTTFLDRFEIQQDLVDRLRVDDVELMKFGFRWLQFALFGENTVRPIKTGSFNAPSHNFTHG